MPFTNQASGLTVLTLQSVRGVELVRVITGNLRTHDVLSRHGGDE